MARKRLRTRRETACRVIARCLVLSEDGGTYPVRRIDKESGDEQRITRRVRLGYKKVCNLLLDGPPICPPPH